MIHGDVVPRAVGNRQWVEVAWCLITWDVRAAAEVAVADIRLYCGGESLPVIPASDQLCGLVNRRMCGRRLVVGFSNQECVEVVLLWNHKAIIPKKKAILD
jgi:hypothetical protein